MKKTSMALMALMILVVILTVVFLNQRQLIGNPSALQWWVRPQTENRATHSF